MTGSRAEASSSKSSTGRLRRRRPKASSARTAPAGKSASAGELCVAGSATEAWPPLVNGDPVSMLTLTVTVPLAGSLKPLLEKVQVAAVGRPPQPRLMVSVNPELEWIVTSATEYFELCTVK